MAKRQLIWRYFLPKIKEKNRKWRIQCRLEEKWLVTCRRFRGRKEMKNNIIIMTTVTIILAVFGVVQQGPSVITAGIIAGAKMLIQVIPLLAAAFVLAGMIQVLISKELINKWLGKDAGLKGILLGAVAGALIPGGPYVFYPIAASFLLSGAEIGAVLAFVVAKNLWTISRLPMEVALMGPRLTAIRYIVTFVFPILVGLIANLFFRNYGERVTEQIKLMQTVGDKK